MIWPVDLALFTALIVAALIALEVRGLVPAVAALVSYSVINAILFAGLGAVDVAFVEFVLGAAVIGVLFLVALQHASSRERRRRRGDPRWLTIPVIAGFLGLMIYASSGLPELNDPAAPAHLHVAPDYIERSLADTNTPNVVTAVLADYRSHDTLGETLVIVTAGLAVLLILSRGRREP